MKSIAEQIESITAPAMAAVRKAVGDLREAETQLEKADRRLATARTDLDKKRVALGKALAKAHEEMGVKQGDRSGRWARFLAEERIDSETARRYMKLAGVVDEALPSPDDPESEVPTYADLGIDNRRTAREREEQPDSPRRERDDIDPELIADREAVEEAGRVEVISAGSGIDLRLGDWRIVLADVDMVDTLISDPPYGKRTHDAETTRSDGTDPTGLTPDYDHWTVDDVTAFVEHWSPRTRGWMVCLTSDDLIPAWRAAYTAAGRTAFPPVACVIRGMSNRKQGDGPASWTVYAMVARPVNLYKWGTVPGAYVGPRMPGAKSGRGKPPWLMENLINDYSRPGDTICDPLAGYGETLLSAWKLRRRAIGSELVDTARREAIIRFHARKAAGQIDIATYQPPRNEAIEWSIEAGNAA